jgi:hypothetical protein
MRTAFVVGFKAEWLFRLPGLLPIIQSIGGDQTPAMLERIRECGRVPLPSATWAALLCISHVGNGWMLF